MVIPFAAGGPTDVLGRVVGAKMSEILGQQVVIENVTGAGGQTGSKRVADSCARRLQLRHRHRRHPRPGPDALQEAALQLADRFHPRGPDRAGADRADRAQGPAGEGLQGVRRLRQGEPERRCSSARPARAPPPISAACCSNYMIGVNITHVPYRGTGPAMQDLIGGRIDYICEVVTTIKSQLDGGTIKGIAMLDRKRSPALPNLPTAEEQGTKDLVAYTWNAIFLPKGAPDADREEAQRRDAAGDARAGGEGQAVVARRRDRRGQSGDAGSISPSSSRTRPRSGRSRSRRAASRWSDCR